MVKENFPTTQQKMKNLKDEKFQTRKTSNCSLKVNENRIEQCCAVYIVPNCQQ